MVVELAVTGKSEWYDVNFPNFISSIINKDSKKINDLRGCIAEQLKKISNTYYRDTGPIEKQKILEAWKDFCEAAYLQSEYIFKRNNRTDINLKDIVGLPVRGKTIEEGILEQKLDSAFEIASKADVVIAVLGLFAGAVGAGYLADYLTGSKPITYIAAPIGAVLGAILTYYLAYLASLPFVNHFGNRLKNVTKAEDNLFMQRIEEYIKYVDNIPKS